MNFRHDYSSVAWNVSVGFTFLARSRFIPALSAMGGKTFSLGHVRKEYLAMEEERYLEGHLKVESKQKLVCHNLAISCI